MTNVGANGFILGAGGQHTVIDCEFDSNSPTPPSFQGGKNHLAHLRGDCEVYVYGTDNLLENLHFPYVNLVAGSGGVIVPPVDNLPTSIPSGWAVVPVVDADGMAVNGVIKANGSAAITGAPPAAASNVGWKAVLYGNRYALGVANNTLVAMTDQWLSVFDDASPPANDASGTAPDSHAAVSFGTDGSGWFTGPVRFTGTVGFFGTTPVGQQTGGPATAGSTYGSTEQAMLQKAYACLQTFGLLS
jgi:hypothetical protein